MPIARSRALGKGNEADAGVQCSLGTFGHDFEAFSSRRVRNGHIAEAAHHPAINRNLEVRFQFETAEKLRNSRICNEWIENVYVIADEDARSHGIESGRTLYLESHTRETQDVAKEN